MILQCSYQRWVEQGRRIKIEDLKKSFFENEISYSPGSFRENVSRNNDCTPRVYDLKRREQNQ